jgi:ATP-dependent DNA helicase RecG
MPPDSELQSILLQVRNGARAGSLESETLDFTQDHKDGEKATARLMADEAICLANTRGGFLVLGVDDKQSGPAAFLGTALDASYLKQRVWELSQPGLAVDSEVAEMEGARLVILRVPESPEIHADTQGRAPRRVNTDCHNMTPDEQQRHREDRRGIDWSARPSDRPPADVAAEALIAARELARNHPDAARQRLARLEDEDLMRELGAQLEDGRLTRAGEVLFCRAAEADRLVYIHRPTPGGEPDDLRRFSEPLVVAFGRVMELVDARRRLTAMTFTGGQQVHLEDFPQIAVREALSNAVVHRDYHQRDPVTVSHSPQILEIASPGPLVAGVTPENILTHASKPRNATLARAARMLGLAEEIGAGVDRMYREMLAAGKDIPAINSTPERVCLALLGGAPNTRIPAYLAELPEEERNDVDTLLTLFALCQHQTIDSPKMAPLLQISDASTQVVLERLAQDSLAMIEPTRGTFRRRYPKYRLREHVLRTLGTAVRYRRRSTDELDRKVIAHVKEYERITNRTVRNLFDVDVNRARDILADLVQREVLVKTSDATRGPSVEYGPGPRFPTGRRGAKTPAAADSENPPRLFEQGSR